jgi:hypothetical protein
MAQTPPSLDRAKFRWEIVTGLAAAVAAIFSFLANHQSAANSQQLAENAGQLEALKIQIAQKAQESDLAIKIYDVVEKALSVEGAASRGHGLAAAAMVTALTKPPLTDDLMRALRYGSQDEALQKQLAGVVDFFNDNPPGAAVDVPSTPKSSSRSDDGEPGFLALLLPRLYAAGPAALNGYRIDLFYCEGGNGKAFEALTDSRRRRADAASAKLKQAGLNDVRLRLLPTLVQARPGYQSNADEIRYENTPSETAAAKALAGILHVANTREVMLTKTPNYISVFYCAN